MNIASSDLTQFTPIDASVETVIIPNMDAIAPSSETSNDRIIGKTVGAIALGSAITVGGYALQAPLSRLASGINGEGASAVLKTVAENSGLVGVGVTIALVLGSFMRLGFKNPAR